MNETNPINISNYEFFEPVKFWVFGDKGEVKIPTIFTEWLTWDNVVIHCLYNSTTGIPYEWNDGGYIMKNCQESIQDPDPLPSPNYWFLKANGMSFNKDWDIISVHSETHVPELLALMLKYNRMDA